MTKKNVNVSAGLRTSQEEAEGGLNHAWFDRNPSNWEVKMENFPKYVKRQNLTRFLVLYEIFKKIINVKGSIVECGVNNGYGILSWTKFSAILEPVNLTRRIYGFDTFEGFPDISDKDKSQSSDHVKVGDLSADTYDEINALSDIHDSTRFLGHIPKIELIKGDAVKTIPDFIDQNRHLVVSLLYLDFDLYEPTMVALENFYPRMPKGSIIAFDELDNPLWPGETEAMVEFCKKHKLRIERLPFDPFVGFAVVE
jgi:hypothetical protein